MTARRGSADAKSAATGSAEAAGSAVGGAKDRGGRAGRSKAGDRGAADGEAKKLPLIPIIAGAAIVLGGAVWFFFLRGDAAPVVAPAEDASQVSETTEASGSPDGDQAAAAAPLTVDAAPTVVEPEVTSDPAMNLAPAPMAPEPTLPDPDAKVEQRNPIIAFEKLGPMPGTEEQFEEWSGWIHTYFIEGPPPREAKVIKVEIDKLDPVDAAPAFINALIDLDMSNAIHVRDAFKLIEYWQDREGRLLHFNFLDATRMEQKDIDSRDKVAEDWAELWRKKMADPEKVEEFRVKVEERLRENKAKDGG